MTTAKINEIPKQKLQGKHFDELVMKEPVVYFLNENNTIKGIGVIVKSDWGAGILTHVDNLPNTDPIRFEAFIYDKKLEGTADKMLEYRERYFVLSVSMVSCKQFVYL